MEDPMFQNLEIADIEKQFSQSNKCKSEILDDHEEDGLLFVDINEQIKQYE